MDQRLFYFNFNGGEYRSTFDAEVVEAKHSHFNQWIRTYSLRARKKALEVVALQMEQDRDLVAMTIAAPVSSYTRMLSKEVAQKAYNAILAMNSVGGVCSLYVDGSVIVYDVAGRVSISATRETHANGESYKSEAAFAETYGLTL